MPARIGQIKCEVNWEHTAVKRTQEAKRAQLIAALVTARSQVLTAAAALAPTQQETVFLGTWSAHDIVAHLIGWDDANREAIAAVRGGRLPVFYAAYSPDWRSFNARLVAQHRRASLAETIAAAQASHQALLAALAAVPAEEIDRDFGVRSPGRRRVTIAMLLAAEASDEGKHAAQIEAFAARSRNDNQAG